VREVSRRLSLTSLGKQRHLLLELTKRDITDRYAGQVLGWLWAVVHPISFILVYIFLFAIVFRAKVPDSNAYPFNYTVYLLSGLVVWLYAQDSIARSAVAIRGNAPLVKQSALPIYLIPLKTVLGTSITLLVSVLLLAIYTFLEYHYLPIGYAYLPVLLAIITIGLVGISLSVSAISLFLRDVKDVTTLSLFVATFTLPIFYLPDMVPEQLAFVMYLNPFAYWIWMAQDTLYYGHLMHPWAWPVGTAFSGLMVWIGAWIFSRLSPNFGNEL
jgi:lipopolysaccharide transport system permease protein